jgi:DNA-binding NarL/FixJ family response regulator
MSENRKTILLVDDHPIILAGLSNLFQEESDFDVVGTTDDGLKAIEMVESLRPDIVIMDNDMPNLNGLEATKQIKRNFSETNIVIYSMFSDEALIYSLFKAGISGYVLKGNPTSEIVMALKAVASGGTFFSEAVGTNLREYLSKDRTRDKEADILDKLSSRERQVFLLLADGVPIKKIAKKLFISPKTVETHKYNIIEKLKLTSLAEFTKIAVQRKLIDI